MPVKVLKKNGKYRVCEQDGKVAKTKYGNAMDGGGHKDKERAMRQAYYINPKVK